MRVMWTTAVLMVVLTGMVSVQALFEVETAGVKVRQGPDADAARVSDSRVRDTRSRLARAFHARRSFTQPATTPGEQLGCKQASL